MGLISRVSSRTYRSHEFSATRNNQTSSFSTCTVLNRKKRIPTKTSKSSNTIGSPGMTIFLKINMVEAVKSEWVKHNMDDTKLNLKNADTERINQLFRVFLSKKYKSLSEDEQAKYTQMTSDYAAKLAATKQEEYDNIEKNFQAREDKSGVGSAGGIA